MLRKIVAYLPSTVVPILLNFALVFIYAGCMAPSEYGVYSVYLNSISLIYAVALSFLQSAALRFYSMEGMYKDFREYYSTYIFANLAICAALAVVLLLANLAFHFNWVVITFAVLSNALYQFDVNLCRLRDDVGQYTLCRLTASIGALALTIACVVLTGTLSYTVPIYTFYGAFLFTIVTEFVRCLKDLSIKHVSKRLLSESFRFGMPMAGVTVAGLLVAYSSQYLIIWLLSEEAVGFYSLGFRLSDSVISNITMVILTVMTPTVMKAYDNAGADGFTRGSAMLKRLINLDTWIVVPCCLLLALYSGDIIRLLFPSYVGAEAVVVAMVFSAVLRSLSMIACKGLELARRTGRMLACLVASLVVNVVYSAAFIPVYGITAAAHASVAAYLTYDVLLVVQSRRYVPVCFDWIYLAKVGLASLAMGVACLAIKGATMVGDVVVLIVQGTLCVLVYLGASCLLGLHKGFGDSGAD